MAFISKSKKSLHHWQHLLNILQLFFVFGLFNLQMRLVVSIKSQETQNIRTDNIINANYDKAVLSLINDALLKRSSWQQLQGSWGKRSSPMDTGNGWSVEPTENDSILAERWVPVLSANGGTLFPQQHPEILKYSMIYLTNAAALKQLVNHRRNENDARTINAKDENDDDDDDRYSDEEGDGVDGDSYKFNNDLFASTHRSENDENISNEKRNWKSINAAWGKRRNEPTWNKFRGVWGKREPGWNNLRGMWGKRSSSDWKKLHSAWGKRSVRFAEMK